MGSWRTISVALQANTADYSAAMDRAGKDTTDFGKDVDQANKKIDELDARLGRAREGLGLGVAAGTVAGLGLATKAASDLREAQAAANVVFGESADVIDAYSTNAAQAIGLSKKEALDATATFGNLFTQLGVGSQEAAGLSTSMVTLAADFGSFFNEDPVRIIEAQTAAFRGEYDALQRYVPTINAAAVEQRALVETGKANADQLTQQEKALATYNLMVEGAGAAQGDFARSSGSAATEAKKAAAETKNASASLGESLLPVAAKAAEVVGTLARGFGSLPGPMQTGIVGIGGMTLATSLLLPKLAETGALLLRGGQKAVDFARGIDTASTANVAAAGSMGLLALGAGVVGMVLADQAAMASKARAQVDQLADSVTKGGQSMAQTVDQYLIDTWAEYGETLSQQGLTFEQFRKLVTGSQSDFDTWRESLPTGNDFLGVDEGLVATRLQLERVADRVARYKEAEDALEGSTSDATAATEAQTGGLGGLGAMLDRLDPKLASVFDAFMEDTRDASQLVGALAGYLQSTADVNAAVVEVAEAQDRVAEAGEAVADAEDAIADANRSVADAREGVADAERGVAEARDGVAEAERRVVDAQVAAADAAVRVTTATEELAQARQDARIDSDYMADSLQRVTDAEERWRETQEDSLVAQEALTQARDDYTQVLLNLSDAAGGAADDVTSAEIRLRDAQENLATLGDDATERVADAQRRLAELGPNATASQIAAAQRALREAIAAIPDADDRTAAEIAVRDAERRLREAQQRAEEAQAELDRNTANGVEGSDAVVAAHGAVETAADNEATAYGELVDAVQGVATTQEEAAARIQTAQENLEGAIRDRAAADQAVVDAKDGVVDANAGVQRAAEGVRDANQQVADRLKDVKDRQKDLIDRKGEMVTAQDDLAGRIRNVRDKLEEQTTWWLTVQAHWAFNSVLRQNLRSITGEIRDLAGLAGTYQMNINVNLGGNAAGAILSGTMDPLYAVLAAATGKSVPGSKAPGPGSSDYGPAMGKPALPSGWVKQANGRWYHPRMPGEEDYGDGYSDYRPGGTPTGRAGASSTGGYAAVATMAPNWAQPATYAATSLNPGRTIEINAPVDARGIQDPHTLGTVLSARLGFEMSVEYD